DTKTGEYCNDVIDSFTLVDSVDSMPESEMCSYCYVERLQMMQRTPYSVYDEYYQTVLKTVHERCGLTGPTDIPPSPITLPEQEEPICLSGTKLTTVEGDTCDSIAQTNGLSSAALYMGNQDQIYNCSKIEANLNL
ncbi:hypothetical protein KXV74_000423, partial [Aspergillus fumigatus]